MPTDKPYMIAIAGVENSHATEMIKYLNVATRRTRAEVVALVGEEDERMNELLELGGIRQRVRDARALIGSVDALIVTNRDGALHAQHAIPFLAAGLPVWVDKPLACSVDDARMIIAEATRTGAPLASYSPLRWVRSTEELVRAKDDIGELQTLTVIGPADADSEYGGIFFYGIHCADIAQRIAPGQPSDIQVTIAHGTLIIRYRLGPTEVTLQLVKPLDHRQVPFHCVLTGRQGLVSTDIGLGPGYVQPGIEAFLGMLDSGRPPVPYDEIRTAVTIMEAAASAYTAHRRR
ncbi:MAG: Gfo/Idh/MocA family oxidoreductase [Microlunatus sp.]|nr:Gfo/Idh/MocA family oxidoreductase [Microlunatus sp.]